MACLTFVPAFDCLACQGPNRAGFPARITSLVLQPRVTSVVVAATGTVRCGDYLWSVLEWRPPVTNWTAHPETVPQSATQDMLDELLAGANPAVRERFGQFAGERPAGPAAPTAEGMAEVVSLGIHPRYAADFRALACGQVAAARAALGLSPDEFAAWLRNVVSWAPVTGGGVIERWKDDRTPPGDVVIAAQAYLAGAR
jgi:hypothetical protein